MRHSFPLGYLSRVQPIPANNLMGVNTFLSPDAFIEAAMAATKII